jgi:hypothetical protein
MNRNIKIAFDVYSDLIILFKDYHITMIRSADNSFRLDVATEDDELFYITIKNARITFYSRKEKLNFFSTIKLFEYLVESWVLKND